MLLGACGDRREALTWVIYRPWIQGFVGKLRGKPLLDIVVGIVEDYDYLWDEYYFSTSTV